MVNLSLENYDITWQRGFNLVGFDSANSRKAAQMKSDDRVVFYIQDTKRFAATATVSGKCFQGHSRIWKHHSGQEIYSHRVRIAADLQLDEEEQVDAYQIGPSLEYVRRWVPEQWNLAFFGMLHIFSQRDFDLIEKELERNAKAS